MSADPLTIVRRFYDGLGQGSIDFTLVDVGIRWRTPSTLPWTPRDQLGHGGIVEYFGLEDLGRYLRALAHSVDGMRAEASTFLRDGSHVVVLGRECGKVRQTGREFAVPFAHVLTVESDKITRLQGYIDTALLAQAFDGPTG